MAPAPAKRSRLRTCLLTSAGLFLAAVCGLVIIGINNMPAGTVVVAPTVRPTSTPEPTARPAPTPLPTAAPAGYVSRATMGDAWPLTVDAGEMKCGRARAVVFVEAETGRYYAVNLPAKEQAPELGLNMIEEIAAPGADVTPLIDVGLALCP